jgi:Transposase DDE domain
VPYKANADRRHHIPRQRHRVTNWAAYDASLRARGSLTVWFSEAAIKAWAAEPRTTRGGQPIYSALAITTMLTLRAVFRLALRQTEGLIGSILQLLGLDLAIPDHSTLSRRAETLDVVPPRSGPDTEPAHLLVDSTGLRLCGPGDWLLEKHGSRRRRSWRKLHLATDADTGRIVASVLTDHDADDGAQVGLSAAFDTAGEFPSGGQCHQCSELRASCRRQIGAAEPFGHSDQVQRCRGRDVLEVGLGSTDITRPAQAEAPDGL